MRTTTVTLSTSPARGSAAAAFERLDLDGVRWAVATGRDELRPDARDVDLLVERSSMRKLDALLRGAGFVRRRVRSANRLYVAYDSTLARWWTLDVATALRIGPCSIASDDLLGRRRRAGDLYVLDADDAFWIAMLGGLATRGAFSTRDRADLLAFKPAARDDSPLASIAEHWSPADWPARRLRSAVGAGEWDRLEEVARRSVPRNFTRLAAARVAAARGLRRISTRLRRILPRRGLAVAVVAFDGSSVLERAELLVARVALPAHLALQSSSARGGAHARLETVRGKLVVLTPTKPDASTVRSHGGARMSRWLARHLAPRPRLTIVLGNARDAVGHDGAEAPSASPAVAYVDPAAPTETMVAEMMALVWISYEELACRRRRRPWQRA